MRNKLIAACMALAAFAAFAVMPAGALATNSPQLMEGATPVPTGTKITGTNEGTLLMRSGPEAGSSILTSCETARMTGTLTKNDGANIEGTIETAAFEGYDAEHHVGECEGTFGKITVTTNVGNGVPWCLRSTSTMATHEFQLRGNSCASAARGITFVLDSTTVGECKYERTTLTGPVKGTYTTGGEASKLTVVGQEFKRESGSFLCPEKGYLFMTFTLETDVSPFTKLTIS
jgi:hypothetical protein